MLARGRVRCLLARLGCRKPLASNPRRCVELRNRTGTVRGAWSSYVVKDVFLCQELRARDSEYRGVLDYICRVLTIVANVDILVPLASMFVRVYIL